MALTDDEILSAAGRVRAGKRRQLSKSCEVCGTRFAGIAQRRYCSDACRVRASRRARAELGAGEQHPIDEASATKADDAASPLSSLGGPTLQEDPIREVLRARGQLDDEHDEPPVPRGESESIGDYLERVARYVSGGRILSERSTELDRAIAGDPETRSPVSTGGAVAAATVSREEADAILAHLDGTRRRIMRGRVFVDDSTETVRRERARRSEELSPRFRS